MMVSANYGEAILFIEGLDMQKYEIDEKTKGKLIGILQVLFPTAKIYLYGSRARGTNQEFSDIDLALDAGEKLNFFDVNEAKNMFMESNIIYKVDIVDLHSVSQEMRETILKEGVLWRNPETEEML